MPFKEYKDVNASEGFQTVFVYVNDVTNGVFPAMLLFSLFLVIMIGSYLSQQRTSGRGDFSASFAMAGFVTAGAAIIMSLVPGMINMWYVSVAVGIAIVGALMLFLGRSSD